MSKCYDVYNVCKSYCEGKTGWGRVANLSTGRRCVQIKTAAHPCAQNASGHILVIRHVFILCTVSPTERFVIISKLHGQ